ncbi:MAG: segregation/condensation protein A [Desulfuromonadales bacterium]|jgi:segregation and condensation protein A
MAYEIKIENFEGPLDLLLHLIKKNEMDIYDIPMAEITAQYLATIDAMKSLNLEVAGEFLLMAATLLHIKSRMLLPQQDPEEEPEPEEEDPRAELVRRLLEYQKYKDAALCLDSRPLLDREVFSRRVASSESDEQEEGELEAVGLFELVDALRRLLRENPEPVFHEVDMERLSVTDRVNTILSSLAGKETVAFTELFSARPGRGEVIVTFLALLELGKMNLVRLLQNTRYGSIWIRPAVAAEDIGSLQLEEDTLGYG